MSIKLGLLAALAPSVSVVEVDGFGPVNIRQLTVAQHDAVRAQVKAMPDAAPSEFGIRMLVASVVDAEGNLVMGDDDLQALRASSGPKVEALMRRALEVQGYAGAAEKNVIRSEPSTSGDSVSVSPSL